MRGQRFPEPLGWWSPRQQTIEPITTASYELQTADTALLDTVIEVHVALTTDVA